MFDLSKELLDKIRAAIIPQGKLATIGPTFLAACGRNLCTSSCMHDCFGGCKGGCHGSCTRSCSGRSR